MTAKGMKEGAASGIPIRGHQRKCDTTPTRNVVNRSKRRDKWGTVTPCRKEMA